MSRRLSHCVCALPLLFSLSSPGWGADKEFPYEAQVVADQAEVRCGPGSGFYVTGYVNENDTVSVHRHDHGGWFMIAPPSGSLSWIAADLVKRISEDRGVVEIEPVDGRPARAIVRIGSQISDDHSYYGRELSNGDEVRILGEEMLNTQRGPVMMLKIVPPAQEFRWIKGEFVVPMNEQLQKKQAADPYQLPPELRKFSASLERPQSFSRERKEEAKGEGMPAPGQEMNDSEQQRAALFDQLDEIDQRYSAMMQLEPAEWELEEIEQGYRRLASGADPQIRELIDQRLQVVAKRKEIQGHYQQFLRVATETSRRDAQLRTMHSGYEAHSPPQLRFGPEGPAEGQGRRPENGERRPAGGENRDASPELPLSSSGSPLQPPAFPVSPPDAEEGPVNPRLNGAGIIQPMNFFPGGPQFALLAPDGRLLAYLEPSPGVPMREWIGQSSGIIGRRTFDSRLQVDVIRVQKIVPVQLVQ